VTEEERGAAIRAMDTTCPHCGAERAPDQAFCVECGYALPPVRGRLAGWRRRWVRRFGWYPGDWVWASLGLLAVAVAGAAAAIALSDHRHPAGRHVITALAGQAVVQPVSPPSVDTVGTLPTPPEPTTATGHRATKATGNQAWPAGQSGWTIVLVSYPKTAGLPAAKATARKAAQKGLPEVGVLDSSRYASLQPGYFVVFTGIYASQAEANGAVNSAHSAGFGAAYSRQIAG
jgi:zinc-ribbon domain